MAFIRLWCRRSWLVFVVAVEAAVFATLPGLLLDVERAAPTPATPLTL